MPVPDRQLRAVLGGLCLVALAALFRQIVFPTWPRASLPSSALLPRPMHDALTELNIRPGERQKDWARSPTRVMAFVPDTTTTQAPPGAAVELGLTRLVARRPDLLQVAALTRSDPRLSLRDRRLLQNEGQELALGFLDGNPALQSCLVPGGRSGITAQTLEQIVGPPPHNSSDRLLRLLGLRPHRSYDCVLLSLRDTSGQPDHRRLLEVWSHWR